MLADRDKAGQGLQAQVDDFPSRKRSGGRQGGDIGRQGSVILSLEDNDGL